MALVSVVIPNILEVTSRKGMTPDSILFILGANFELFLIRRYNELHAQAFRVSM